MTWLLSAMMLPGNLILSEWGNGIMVIAAGFIVLLVIVMVWMDQFPDHWQRIIGWITDQVERWRK